MAKRTTITARLMSGPRFFCSRIQESFQKPIGGPARPRSQPSSSPTASSFLHNSRVLVGRAPSAAHGARRRGWGGLRRHPLDHPRPLRREIGPFLGEGGALDPYLLTNQLAARLNLVREPVDWAHPQGGVGEPPAGLRLPARRLGPFRPQGHVELET